MKASPLLRAWIAPAGGRRASRFRTRWRWTGWRHGAAGFATPEGSRGRSARARPCWRSAAAPGRGSARTAPGRAILAAEGVPGRAVPPLERRLPRRLVAGDGAALRRAGQAGAPHRRRHAASRPSSSSPPAASRAAASTRSRTSCATARRSRSTSCRGATEAAVAARLARPRGGASLSQPPAQGAAALAGQDRAPARVRAARRSASPLRRRGR